MTSLIGRRLGRYELRAELGRGGMARVYRALDTLLQRQVAIKVLAAQLSLDPEFVRRFDREATTAANLRHPSIVTVYDVGEQDGLHYIAMELVNGRSLHAVLEEHTTLGLGYAVSILEPVARALDFAHAQGAIHRDIKPHNILIDHDGRVMLTDFGIAQTPDSDGERLTRTGIFMGTPEYISPEQAEARRVDGRSDLYALGVVAYEIITGRVPFAGATPQLIVAHSQLPPPPPTSVVAHLPGELDEVLAKALAKRPERRYASGQALVDALRSVASRYGTPLATREQVAALTEGLGELPRPPIPQPVPAPPARPRPEPAPRPQPAAPARQPTPAQRPQPAAPATALRPPRPVTAGTTRAQAPAAPRPQTGARGPSRRRAEGSPLPLLLIGTLLVLLTGAFIFLAARGLANGPVRFPTSAPPSPTLAVPTAAPPASPTGGLVGTALPVASPSPSATAAPSPDASPEATARPPTAVPQPTLAPQPRPTQPPTQPPPPATATPPPVLATSTATAEPPTLTPTSEPPSPTPTETLTPTPPPTRTEETPILSETPIIVGTITPEP